MTLSKTEAASVLRAFVIGRGDKAEEAVRVLTAEESLPVTIVRPCVRKFAELMEQELRENDHKAGWQDDSVPDLMRRLKEEVAEVADRWKRRHEWKVETWPEMMASECADVANFAMMIADVAGGLPSSAEAPRGGEKREMVPPVGGADAVGPEQRACLVYLFAAFLLAPEGPEEDALSEAIAAARKRLGLSDEGAYWYGIMTDADAIVRTARAPSTTKVDEDDAGLDRFKCRACGRTWARELMARMTSALKPCGCEWTEGDARSNDPATVPSDSEIDRAETPSPFGVPPVKRFSPTTTDWCEHGKGWFSPCVSCGRSKRCLRCGCDSLSHTGRDGACEACKDCPRPAAIPPSPTWTVSREQWESLIDAVERLSEIERYIWGTAARQTAHEQFSEAIELARGKRS